MSLIRSPIARAAGASPKANAPRGAARRRVHPLIALVFRKLASGLLTLLIASILIFVALQVLPGDVVQSVLGRQSTPQAVASIRAELRLNQPLPQRYVEWLGGVLTGHLGDSTAAAVQGTHLPIWNDIRQPLFNSAVLAIAGTVAFVILSIALGLWSALRRDGLVDRTISATTLAIGAMPEFVIAAILIDVFFSWLRWFPPVSSLPSGTPLSSLNELVLPLLTLVGVAASYGIRMVRATVIDVMSQDYVVMARLNGYSPLGVVLRFILPNCVSGTVQAFANIARYMIGGIIIVESVFAYPGIGGRLVQAVGLRDIQEVAAISMILAAVYIAINIAADIAVIFFEPRLRTEVIS